MEYTDLGWKESLNQFSMKYEEKSIPSVNELRLHKISYNLVPGECVGHIGLYRDPKTLTVVEYYFKMPKNMENRDVIVINTMLTTGHSAIAAMERIQELNPKLIKFICLISSPEGIDIFHRFYPDIAIYTLSVDRELNEEGFILPGFGDAGDRIFGTK